MGRRLAGLFHGRPRLQAGGLLAGPVGWLVVGYLGSLAVLLVTSFWTLGELSGEIEQSFTLDNYKDVVTEPVYRAVTGRTVLIAALVTVTDALLAFPIAFYMAKVARPRVRGILVVAVLVPLWSAYLVKAFAWRGILSQDGVLNWLLNPFGIENPGYGMFAVWLVMSYIWLPYMIIPIYAGLERIPDTLLERIRGHGREARPHVPPRRAAAGLPGRCRRFDLHVLADAGRLHHPEPRRLRRAVPRDPRLRQLLGRTCPFAAAVATVPIVIMIIYLLIARRTGAFEHV